MKMRKIDEDGMRDQVDYVIEGGLDGILAYGSNGEFYQIEEDEMERGFRIMVDQAAAVSLSTLALVPSIQKEVRSSG